MTRRPAPWKIVTLGAALAGLGATGIGVAAADGTDDRDGLPGPVSVAAPAEPAADSAGAAPVDASPESADSPDQSVQDSPDAQSADTPDAQSADTPDGTDSVHSADSPDED